MATDIPKIAERFLMVRRPLRPSFELMDKTRLIEAMRSANELAGRYVASSSCKNDSVRQECDELRKAIHKVATSLTGDPLYFAYRYDPLPPTPTPEELDSLATALFNGYHRHPDHMHISCYDEIERRGIPNEIEEWNALRAALELMPNTMFVALQKTINGN